MVSEKALYTLITLEDFKSIMGVDDREEKLARFCLVMATSSIEQYCMRLLLRKKHFERIEFSGDLLLPLSEYPVNEILAVHTYCDDKIIISNLEILEPEFYAVIPDCGLDIDLPFSLSLSPALLNYRGFSAVKVVYWSGYPINKVPADLASACMELAAWNLNRYRGRRVGMTGNIRGAGKEGEHFEASMPTNVRQLLEPYKRRVI